MQTPEQIAAGLVGLLYTEALEERMDGRAYIQHIASALLAYGAACAQQERARCADIAAHHRYPQGGADDEWRGAMLMRDYIAAAIRDLE